MDLHSELPATQPRLVLYDSLQMVLDMEEPITPRLVTFFLPVKKFLYLVINVLLL
jgi:hypothetical protein